MYDDTRPRPRAAQDLRGQIWPQRRHIDIARLWPLVAGGVLGIPIGVRLLVYTDANVMKTVLGVFLLVFGSYALLAPRLHTR